MKVNRKEIVDDPISISQNADSQNITDDDTKGDTVKKPLTNRQNKIIIAMSENPFINGEELMDVFKISIATLRREISSLKASGYIKCEGSDKSGYWLVLKRPNGPMSVYQ